MVAPKISSAVAQSNGLQVLVTFDQAMKQDAAFFNLVNWTVLPGHAVAVVAGPSVTTALLTITPEMLTAAALTVTVNTAVENILNEGMDPGFNSLAFNGLGISPEIASVVATGPNTIRVTFNEPMTDNAALIDAASYVFAPSPGAVPLVITTSIIQEAVANPTFVDIPVNEMTDAADYTFSIAAGAGLQDVVGNVIDPDAPNNIVVFVGNGTLPSVASAVVLAGGIIRINFDEPMRKDAQLSFAANYLFTPVTAGAAQLFFDEISVPDIDNPTFVEISVSEMTDGATYDITVDGPTDLGFNPIGVTDTATFIGEGVNPIIDLIVAVSKNRVDVVFSESMKNNIDINDPARYTWDNSLLTLDVLEVTPAGIVKLSTNDQVPGILYTLTVAP